MDHQKTINSITPNEWDSLKKNKYDPVTKPEHYNTGGIECIDYIDQQLGEGTIDYCQGNVIKYLHRWRYKAGLQDLKKAKWYLERMIDLVEEFGE